MSVHSIICILRILQIAIQPKYINLWMHQMCYRFRISKLRAISLNIILLFLVTSNQIERLWSRFTSLDKQQKGHLTREDFLRIPELAINPLGDRIVHAFFRDSSNKDEEVGGKFNGANEKEIVNFPDFVRVLAHFRPIKKNAEKNKMNSRTEKLRCK